MFWDQLRAKLKKITRNDQNGKAPNSKDPIG